MKRILVTGSRDWPYAEVVWQELARAVAFTAPNYEPVKIVEGACPSGADNMAHGWIEHLHSLGAGKQIRPERHPADWGKHGKAAGFIRNQEMVDLGADLCLAFRLNGSKGATHCIERAQAADIPCRIIDLQIADRRTELREEDLKIEVTRDIARAGMYVPSGNTTVRITHLPTGKFAIATEKSALHAKAVALKDLRTQVLG